MSYKTTALRAAYSNGLRRCPCCDVQLVWKSYTPKPQKNLATVDHMVPVSIGGGNSVDNMFVMCRDCNSRRGNTCFVQYVTTRGYSKAEAEQLYRKAHIASIRNLIYTLVTQGIDNTKRNRIRKEFQMIVKNYKKYFKEYLPEFELLPQDLCR